MIENSKSILDIFKLSFALIDIVIKHNPNLKRLELEAYSDYKDALGLKNHLSYKLGRTLIKANKNWYKGGYIKFIFEVIKIRMDYNKRI